MGPATRASITSSPSPATTRRPSCPVDTPLHEGELAAWVTLNSLGAFTLTATDQTDAYHLQDTTSPIPVEPVVTPPTFLHVDPIGLDQVAGQPVMVTIEALRANGTRNHEIEGPVALHQATPFGPGVMSPETVTLTAGAWTGLVTFYLAGPRDTDGASVQLLAEMSDPSIHGLSNPFDVGPGAYSRLLVIAPGQTWTPWILDGLGGTPDQQWCDQPFDVDVFATDEYWNRVDVAEVAKLESGDPEANTPLIAPLVEGQHTFPVVMRTPGAWFLAVSDLDQPEIGGMVSQDLPVYYAHLQILLPGQEPAPGTVTGQTGQPRPRWPACRSP